MANYHEYSNFLQSDPLAIGVALGSSPEHPTLVCISGMQPGSYVVGITPFCAKDLINRPRPKGRSLKVEGI